MGMYDVFETDSSLETSGIWLDYGEFRVKVAFGGESNKNYTRYAEAKTKPVRRAIQSGAMSTDKMRLIMMDVYAHTVVLDWQVNTGTEQDPQWSQGIESRDGSLMDFTTENVLATLTALPHLFQNIQEAAMDMANFRKEELEKEAKN